MIGLVCIPLMACLNHIRGQWGDTLPLFHPRFWCLLPVFLTACIALPWAWALYFTLCWLCMNSIGWGRWYDLDYWDAMDRDDPTWFEALVEWFPGYDFVHLLIRNTICGLPLLGMGFFWQPAALLVLLGPAQTAAYALGWRINKTNGVQPAEWISGAMWGLALSAAGGLS